MLERAFGKSHHEDRTIDLILSESSCLNKVMIRHGIDPKSVASIIRKDFPEKLAVDVVSSQLDADRMDYLLRDSYCTGVGYGEYDPDWLFHAMCIGRVKGDANKAHQKLCLDQRRGLYAAERFVIARLHMYQQVYMHRVTRGFEVLALNLFKAAAYSEHSGGLPTCTPSLVTKYFKNEGKLNLDEFIRFDESQVVAAFHCWAEATGPAYATIRRLACAFLNRERLYASTDIVLNADGLMRLGHGIESMPKELDGATALFKVDTFEDTPYKGMLYRARQNATAEEMINESILLADPDDDESAKPVETLSRMLKNLDAEKFEVNRLYFDRSRRTAIEPLAKELKIHLPTEEA
jgi:HD superfamily phosphohydrolase